MLGRETRGVDGYVLRTALMRIRFDRWSIRNGARHRPFFFSPPSLTASNCLSIPWIIRPMNFYKFLTRFAASLRTTSYICTDIYIWGRNSEGFGRRIRNAIRNSRFSSPNKKRYESLRIALFAGMNVVKNNSILLSRGGGKKWNYERSIDTGRFQSSRINCENKKRNLPRYA